MILVYTPSIKETQAFVTLFKSVLPNESVVTLETMLISEQVRYIVCWGAEPGFFEKFVNLECVFALGAGVDSLIFREDLPLNVKIVRLLDAGMAQQMIEYVRFGTLYHQRRMGLYRAQQVTATWMQYAPRLAADMNVLVLGAGVMGAAVSTALKQDGYAVKQWSHTQNRHVSEHFYGLEPLTSLLAQADVVAVLLPLTAQTRGLLNETRLGAIKEGAMLINAARGAIIEEQALSVALQSERLGGALLDVFAQEPLSADSQLWRLPNVLITPHVAAITIREKAVQQICENIQRLKAGKCALGEVDRSRGY